MPIRVRGLPAVEVGVRVVKSDGQRLDLLHLVWSLLQQHGVLRLGRVIGLGLVVVGVRGVIRVRMVGFGFVVAPVVRFGMVGVVMWLRMVGVVMWLGMMVRIVMGLGLMVWVVVGLGLVVGVFTVGIGCKEVRFFIEVLVVEGRVLRRPLVFVMQHKVVKILTSYDVLCRNAVAQGVELGKRKVSKIIGLLRDRLPSRRQQRGQGLVVGVGRWAGLL